MSDVNYMIKYPPGPGNKDRASELLGWLDDESRGTKSDRLSDVKLEIMSLGDGWEIEDIGVLPNLGELYAVSHIDFGDNNLKTEIVYAHSPFEAIYQHSDLQSGEVKKWLDEIAIRTVESFKQEFFNCDAAIDVVKVNSAYLVSFDPDDA